MTARIISNQIAFRYRGTESATPQYEVDGGPLTTTQVRQIKKQVPQDSKRSIRSSLF